jgi:hypothetical protein
MEFLRPDNYYPINKTPGPTHFFYYNIDVAIGQRGQDLQTEEEFEYVLIGHNWQFDEPEIEYDPSGQFKQTEKEVSPIFGE